MGTLAAMSTDPRFTEPDIEPGSYLDGNGEPCEREVAVYDRFGRRMDKCLDGDCGRKATRFWLLTGPAGETWHSRACERHAGDYEAWAEAVGWPNLRPDPDYPDQGEKGAP